MKLHKPKGQIRKIQPGAWIKYTGLVHTTSRNGRRR